jgi:outer membrane protein TolC
VSLKNKIKAQQTEINSLEKQKQLIDNLVTDYNTMLASEERLFSFGESSIFLINARENNLVSAQLSQLLIENRYFDSNAKLFKIMANPE